MHLTAIGRSSCSKQRGLIARRVLREGGRKAGVGHPDQTIAIRRQLRSIGMRLLPVEDIRNGFTLVRCQCGNEDQCADPRRSCSPI